MLTISHTRAEGTLIEGTRKGDGTNDVLKAQGWRWSRTLSLWYVPHSRDRDAKNWVINATVKALEESGHTVVTDTDDTARPTAEVEADKIARQADRADWLADKATKVATAAEAADERAHELAHQVPLGQPILVGHHSEGKMRCHYERVASRQDKAVKLYREATTAAEEAASAAKTTGARYSPVTVGNRIEKLEAEIREVQRGLDGYTRTAFVDSAGQKQVEVFAPAAGGHRDRLAARSRELADQWAYWQQIRADQIDSGTATNFGPGNVAKGDQVKIRGTWYRVVRANKKTVTVPSPFGSWTDTAPYREIQDHRAG